MAFFIREKPTTLRRRNFYKTGLYRELETLAFVQKYLLSDGTSRRRFSFLRAEHDFFDPDGSFGGNSGPILEHLLKVFDRIGDAELTVVRATAAAVVSIG